VTGRRDLDAIFGHPNDLVFDLPFADRFDDLIWGAHPRDELAYERLIRLLCAWPDAVARRSWREEVDDSGLVSRREEPPRVRHAIVDWTSEREDSPLLNGEIGGAWIDPDCLHVGGVSRVRDDMRTTLAERPGAINVEFREWSFLTLDTPTWHEDRSREGESLVRRLILPLVNLSGTADDTLYGWLALIFAFCGRSELAYYSRYVPGAEVHAIAREHGVRVRHSALRDLPEALVASNAAYRSMRLSLGQWRELRRRLEAAGRMEEAAVLREHGA
jgi:hypothetical protein